MSFDIAIKSGIVVDGTGNPWFKADVYIKDGKIVHVGRLDSVGVEKTINAKGLVVCPGFIDMHTHSDCIILLNPMSEAHLREGVTTDLTGNCGASAAPLRDIWLRCAYLVGEHEWWREISTEEALPIETVETKVLEKYGWKLDMDWSTMGEFLDRVEMRGTAINFVPLVGHNAVRAAVMGVDERKPTEDELREMKNLVARAMVDGAFGLSTGLDYAPGKYADTEEVIELARTAGKYGGIYVTHLRGQLGRVGQPNVLVEGLREAFEIGEKAEVPVHISHMSSLYRVHPPILLEDVERTLAEETLKLIDDARARGIDVTFDFYTYRLNRRLWMRSPLISVLDPWVRELGSKEKVIETLKKPAFRAEVKRDLVEKKKGEITFPYGYSYWADVMRVIRSEKNKELEGKTISEITRLRRIDPYDVIFDLLKENPNIEVASDINRPEAETCTFLKHPASMIGSDTASNMLPIRMGVVGNFPRVLGRYVREKKVITLEEAIRKMTSLPAQRLGLKDRGLIKEGMSADIVIFDADRVTDGGTYENVYQYPRGIVYVLVNGDVAIEKGEHTGTIAGKVLRAK